MLPPLLSIQQTHYSKIAAWVAVGLLTLAGANFLKGIIASFVLKLYEILIQRNGVV